MKKEGFLIMILVTLLLVCAEASAKEFLDKCHDKALDSISFEVNRVAPFLHTLNDKDQPYDREQRKYGDALEYYASFSSYSTDLEINKQKVDELHAKPEYLLAMELLQRRKVLSDSLEKCFTDKNNEHKNLEAKLNSCHSNSTAAPPEASTKKGGKSVIEKTTPSLIEQKFDDPAHSAD